MIFAALHALLGCALAALACLLLRNRPADARCWAWRLGLLKGPLALVLGVPVVVSLSLPARVPSFSASSVKESNAKLTRVQAPPSRVFVSPDLPPTPKLSPSGGVVRTVERISLPPSSPFPLLPVIYLVGLAASLAGRRLAAHRLPRGGPRVVGVVRPRVVVPKGLAPDAAAMALAHEEAHVRRRDPQWSLVAEAVYVAFWFIPPVWLAAGAMRAEAEAACDADALRATAASPRAYARLLLDHAGPAPALALGGPARRLARRILMLEHTPKPLSRLVAAATLVLGLAAFLPWRAEAKPASALDAPSETRIPARATLGAAMRELLARPEARAKLRLTSAQAETLARNVDDYHLTVLETRRRDALSNLKKYPQGSRDSMAQATRSELARVTQEEAKILARGARKRPAPLSDLQRRQLASLALESYGGATWEDPFVAEALGLSDAQIGAAKAQNEAIAAAQEGDRTSGEFGSFTMNLEEKLRRGGLSASERKRTEASLRSYRDLSERFRPLSQKTEPRFWRMRGAADARLDAMLTPEQRVKLERLRRDPEAWPAIPSDVFDAESFGISLWPAMPAVQIPPTDRAGKKIAPMPGRGITFTASHTGSQGELSDGEMYLSEDVAINGMRLSRLTFPSDPSVPLRFRFPGGGRELSIYRISDRPGYAFRLVTRQGP